MELPQEPHACRPLLLIAGALALGAGTGADLPPGALPPLLGAVTLALLVAPLRAGCVGTLGLLAAALGVGAAARSVEQAAYQAAPLGRLAASEPEAPVLLQGVARSDSRRLDERVQLLLDVSSARVRGVVQHAPGRARVVVADPARSLAVSQGEALAVWARLRPPRGFASDGAFDAEADARRRGIHAHGFAKSAALVERRPEQDARGPGARLGRARRWARAVLRARLPAGEEEGLVRAMLLGDREGLSREASEAFRIAGTYHVLALSGAQVALVAGLIVVALWMLRLPPAATAASVCVAVWLYALFVGAETPVVRAALMAAVLAGGKALDLDSDAANLLGLAAGVLLVDSPSAIGDVSFQLSFAATLAVIRVTPPLAACLPRLPMQAQLVVAASAAAQIALAPLMALHFHRLAPAALLLNLAAGPLASGVLLAGFALLAAEALAPVLARPVAELCWLLAHALLRSSDGVRGLPWLDARVPDPPWLAVLAHLAGLAALVRGRRALAAPLLLAGLAALALGTGGSADGRLRVSVLDVGQGDAIVLLSPGGRALAVDAGPAWRGLDAGEAVVAPFLWSRGVTRLDALALTHADGDHVGGAAFLERALGAAEVWVGPGGPGEQDGARGARPGRRIVLRPGGRLDWDGVEIAVVGPPRDSRSASVNEASLMLRVRYRAVSMLLTGDAGTAAEARLSAPRTDVLKVGHHGSRTSSGAALLGRLRPSLAVVSVGRANPFGHPHPEVLGRLLAAGARVLRTDRDGTVTVSTDGAQVVVRSARLPGSEAR